VETVDRGKDLSLEKRVVGLELQRFLQSRLNCLPLKQREVLELCFYGGLTQREIAAIMATPLRTVKTRLELGLRRIAKQVIPFARKCSKMPMNVSREELEGASWGYGPLGPKMNRGAKIRGKEIGSARKRTIRPEAARKPMASCELGGERLEARRLRHHRQRKIAALVD